MKKFTEDEIENAWKAAPKSIQDALGSVDSAMSVIAAVTAIGSEHKLHVDQIGLLVTINNYMLLGLISPEEFLAELIVNKIPDAEARKIMDEINQKIFSPLREKMRSGPVPAARPTPPPVPRPVTPAPAPTPRPVPQQAPAPTRQPITDPARELPVGEGVHPVAPLPPKVVLPGAAPAAPSSRLINRISPPSITLESRAPGAPALTPAARPTPPPPANLPGALPVSDLLPPKPPASTAKPYTVDPYREPPE